MKLNCLRAGEQGAQELANQRRKLQDEQATLTLQQAELKADEDELRMQRLQMEADQKANAETLQVEFHLLLYVQDHESRP